MENQLDSALLALSLEEEEPLILKNQVEYSSCDRNAMSIIGRLLNPSQQSMKSLIFEFPRVWGVYDRVRGVALSEDQFQFIFRYEEDLIKVLQKVWTQNDWCVVLDRWIKEPPDDFLTIVPVWVRVRNIPVNFYTVKTIEDVCDKIGKVDEVAYDPERSQSAGYVRVRVFLDVNRPLRPYRTVQVPDGSIVKITFEYERIRKRCFHCFRLSHEKQSCPLLNPETTVNKAKAREVVTVETSNSKAIIGPDDPLYGVLTEEQVGFDQSIGRHKIAKEVLNEMRQYLQVHDPSERNARVLRIQNSIAELENDPKGQKTRLRLEKATKITSNLDKDKGLVFYSEPVTASLDPKEKLLSSTINSGVKQRMGLVNQSSSLADSAPLLFNTGTTGIREGSDGSSSSGTCSQRRKTRKRPTSWKRKEQKREEAESTAPKVLDKSDRSVELSLSCKRKASGDVCSPSKTLKLQQNSVVPTKGPLPS